MIRCLFFLSFFLFWTIVKYWKSSIDLNIILDASSHLYKKICPYVRPSVRMSVRRYVRPFSIQMYCQKSPNMNNERRQIILHFGRIRTHTDAYGRPYGQTYACSYVYPSLLLSTYPFISPNRQEYKSFICPSVTSSICPCICPYIDLPVRTRYCLTLHQSLWQKSPHVELPNAFGRKWEWILSWKAI